MAATHNHNKIILNLMIKNESKIIKRCLMGAMPYVDAISILDTGSTDDTVNICRTFLEKSQKPFRVSVDPFIDFGHNRTISFQKTQELCKELGWDAHLTYAMTIDADMIIRVGGAFKDFKMTHTGYRAIQKNTSLKYYNIRFMQCAYNWKCIGVTHEYWSGEGIGTISEDVFYIDDINDGGCKSDKVERDIRLLTEDLKKDPANGRTYFYLAQTFRDSGKYNTAIEHYKRRIEIGGWAEEVWYSHYQIARCYESLCMPDDMEFWANKAFAFRPTRAEPLYILTRYFRIHGEYYKSYHYYLKGRSIPYPASDVLFIEPSVYGGLFDYENTIISNYISNKTRFSCLKDVVDYINTGKYYIDNVWSNLEFYVDILTTDIYGGNSDAYLFPDIQVYHPSSASIIPRGDGFLMNVRYVNYIVDATGYHSKSADGIVRTKNAMTILNSAFEPIQEIQLMNEIGGVVYPCNIMGLEDIRLFSHGGEIYCSAANKDRNPQNNFRIVIGKYNGISYEITDITTIEPPVASTCEKNWIYVPWDGNDKMNFIYKWHPLEIGAVSDGTLSIHSTHNTPPFFSRIRGSSPMCEFGGYLWCVVHIVKHTRTRIYFHSVIGFNPKTLKPVHYSLPFSFSRIGIEYCLGFHILGGDAIFIISQNDSKPTRISIPFTKLQLVRICC